LEGEDRLARRKAWQDPSEPPPGPYTAKHVTWAEDRVAYLVSGNESQFRLSELIDHGVKALDKLILATDEFLDIFDKECGQFGLKF
jgi:hypothetical protein